MPLRVYLEAPTRTQALLTTKWTLRSCGCEVASTWHEKPVLTATDLQNRWSGPSLDELSSCEALVVLREDGEKIPPELAFVLGFAMARNLQVIWLGSPMNLPRHLSKIRYFSTIAEFQRQFPNQDDVRLRRSA